MFLSLFPPSITVLPLRLAAMLSHWNHLIWKELLLYKWLAVTKHHWEISNIFPHRWIRKASYTCKNFHSYCNTVSPVSTMKNFTFSCLSATSSFALRFPVIIKPGHPYFTVSLCRLFQSWSSVIIHGEFKHACSHNNQNSLIDSRTQRAKIIQGANKSKGNIILFVKD